MALQSENAKLEGALRLVEGAITFFDPDSTVQEFKRPDDTLVSTKAVCPKYLDGFPYLFEGLLLPNVLR